MHFQLVTPLLKRLGIRHWEERLGGGNADGEGQYEALWRRAFISHNSSPEAGGHSSIDKLLFNNRLPRDSEVFLVEDQDFFQIT